MKKLIIAAAIVCAAAISQAAAFSWQDASVTDVTGKSLYSGAFTMYFAEKNTANYAVATTGTMSNGEFETVLDDEKFVAGTTYTFYYTMTAADGSVYTSESKNKKANISSTQYVIFAAGGEWVAAPEPTSGLLLLLGMAGLALKRKRA